MILGKLLIAILCCATLEGENQKTENNKDVSPPPPIVWGELKDGLRTALIPLKQEYHLDKEIAFKIIVENTTGTTVEAVSAPPVMTVWDSTGKELKDRFWFAQILISPLTIPPLSQIVLNESESINGSFLFANRGKYSVSFNGDLIIPKSNTVEINITDGEESLVKNLASKLNEASPGSWYTSEFKEGQVEPYERMPVKGLYLSLLGLGGAKGDRHFIDIWIVEEKTPVSENTPQRRHIKNLFTPIAVSDYFGHCESGYVYIIADSNAENTWPTYEADIKKILGVVDDGRSSQQSL